MNEIEEKLKTLPEKSGVYIMKNSDGEIIYVGKAKILKNRIRQYFKNHNHPVKVRKMVENVADFEYIITDNEQEALILENNLIKENMPRYNILLKDDKTYPFIKITVNEDYPRVFVTRKVLRDGSKYYGPYCSNFNVSELMELIEDVFALRKCKKSFVGDASEVQKSRPCLYHQIGKCMGVCTGAVSKSEYRERVQKVISFLNGKSDDVINLLTQKMKKAAQELDFETAAAFRDRISSVSMLSEKQKIVSATGSDCDAIAVYNSDDCACVEIFFIRSGKIVGKEHYFINSTDETSSNAILNDFIKQYYADCTFIPSELIVQHEIEEKELIQEWLSEITGRSVKITTPKIGDKLKLVSMIASNAKKEHHERILKLMRDISFKDNALSDIQKLTHLPEPPYNIEAFDISNISGQSMVGAMVCYVNGKPCRERYRNFKIKYTAGQDDYTCMKEVVRRRIEHGLAEQNKVASDDSSLKKASFLPFPDILFVDGGLGHVQAVNEVMKQCDVIIPVFGIVKDDRHRTDGLVSENGRIDIPKDSEAFMLLTQIQDEMHRRAITHHRNLRSASSLKTSLLQIDGIGEKKARILLRKFKSVKAIKEASLEELIATEGIDRRSAENVFSYFSGKSQ